MTEDDAEYFAIKDLLDEFGYDENDLAAEVLKLRAQVKRMQQDLDEAVGYRLVTAEETRGDQDNA